jgi:hypothetical protein
LGQEVWLGLKHAIEVHVQVLTKLWRELVQEADQGIAEAELVIDACAWRWIESRPLSVIVFVKSIGRASNAMLSII